MMESKNIVNVEIGTWSQYEIEYSQTDIKVVGDYNLKNGKVENIGQAVFKRYKRWDHQKVNLLRRWDGKPYVDMYARQGSHDHEHLHHLLQWVMIKSYNLADNKIDFVCKQGILRLFGDTLYRKNSWIFEVCRFNGLIYLSRKFIPENEPDLDISEKRLSKCRFFGTAFEELVAKGEGATSYIVTECKLNDVKCLIAGEIDCKDEYEYVEIKTAHEHLLSEKMQSSWLQGHLIGIHKLVYGLRDDNFNLDKVIEEPIGSVPGKYQEEGKWNGQQILGFIYSVLQRIKNEVLEGRTYTLEYKGGDTDYLLRYRENETFLSDEFIRYEMRNAEIRPPSYKEVEKKIQILESSILKLQEECSALKKTIQQLVEEKLVHKETPAPVNELGSVEPDNTRLPHTKCNRTHAFYKEVGKDAARTTDEAKYPKKYTTTTTNKSSDITTTNEQNKWKVAGKNEKISKPGTLNKDSTLKQRKPLTTSIKRSSDQNLKTPKDSKRW